MKAYLKFLAIIYLIGFALHFLDLLDLRMKFSEMTTTWKIWTSFLLSADLIAFIGLWRGKFFGEVAFFAIAISQLIGYGFFKEVFGNQLFLIVFHSATLSTYLALILWKRNYTFPMRKNWNKE